MPSSVSRSIFTGGEQVIHCLPCYPLLFHAGNAQYPSPITCTPEVKSSITLQLKILQRTQRFLFFFCVWSFEWPSAFLRPIFPTSQLGFFSPPPPSPFFCNIFILLSQTGANGMCGQDFRIHHRLAEELAWAPCITCQSCQARRLPRFIIALLVFPSALASPQPQTGGLVVAAVVGGGAPYHAPRCQPRSAATKLGYTVGLLEIRERSGRSFCLPRTLSETSDSPSLLLSFHSSSSSSSLRRSFKCVCVFSYSSGVKSL